MAVPWRAAENPDPRLLVLNEPLAIELGIDPIWLRSSDGLRLLLGTLLPQRFHPGGPGLRRAPVRLVRARASATGVHSYSVRSSTATAAFVTST